MSHPFFILLASVQHTNKATTQWHLSWPNTRLRGQQQQQQNQKSTNQGESSAINEEDDIDTALNKLEKSLANTTVTDNGHANTDLSATKAPATTPEFKLALSEQLLLMQPPKTADYQEVQELLLCPGQRMLSQLLMGVHSEMRQN